MNYTIRLTHGSAFWTTVFDSTGASWSSGPFHAGTNQDVGCLATLTGQEAVGGVMADSKSESEGGVGIGALAGGVVGAFVAGLILAALAMMFLAKKKKRSHVCSLPRSFLTLTISRLLISYAVFLSIATLSEWNADPRTETAPQTPWMDTTIPKSAQQHGDPIPTHPSPNHNQ
jgi:large-conductance mechanosensitive channel